jgi:hypothetical protein
MSKPTNEATDPFSANRAFPDAAGVFYSGYKPLEAIVRSAIVVLDTNALLVPYGVGTRGLTEIASAYRRLVSEDRLVVPGQVAREFARNRPVKLAELFQALGRKRDFKGLQRGRYPLLEGVDSYERLAAMEKDIDEKLAEYRRTVDAVLEHVLAWTWNDPVSAIYGEIFPRSVEDPQLELTNISERLNYSVQNKIPPGYKDASKDDGGVGDILIWETILAVGAARQSSVIFVSGDVKPDWVHRAENTALFPRFELIDEFRRVSGGETLHIVSFSRLLELFGATAETVQQVRREEVELQTVPDEQNRAATLAAYAAEKRVHAWFRASYPDFTIDPHPLADWVVSDGGASSGVEVKFFQRFNANRLRDVIENAKAVLQREDCYLDSIYVFLVGKSAAVVSELRDGLRTLSLNEKDGVLAVVGRLLDTGDLVVHDPLDILPRMK